MVRAYAFVATAPPALELDPTVDMARSRNAVRAELWRGGGYCVYFDQGIDLATSIALVNIVESNGEGNLRIFATVNGCFNEEKRGVHVSVHAENYYGGVKFVVLVP